MKKGSIPFQHHTARSSSPHSVVDRRQLLLLLQQHFGYGSFRGMQLEVIETVLSGKDCFCLMPTGGGKSMCYELPALAKPGVVLVVSPLIALMESQVLALKARNISAEYLSSTQTPALKSKINDELESGRPSLRLLYVTPELISTAGFMKKLKVLHGRGLLTLIAVDEAHCISSWGHDFRPSYRKLSSLRSSLPGIPMLALTATASTKVQKDVVSSLCLREPRVIITSFNRPNIFYEVRFKNFLKDTYGDLLKMLKTAPEECAIIYCHSRAACDDIGARLLKDTVPCKVYHAGMSAKSRSQSLDDWTSGKVSVVVATVAFGMGIDRKDVRLVCHFSLPKSLEGFYQESGRAGRDQKPARSVLYYGIDDKNTMEFLLKKESTKQKTTARPNSGPPGNAALDAFLQMVQYCEGKGCRRQAVLAHFGEKVSPELCSRTCDSCRYPQKISRQLEELAELPRTSSRSLSSSVLWSKQLDNNCASKDITEFWKVDEDGDDEGSEDEISSSDDEAAQAAAAVASKLRRSFVETKVDALLHAEEAFASKQGAAIEKSSQETKVVTQSIRDTAIQRLESGVVQAFQRLRFQECAPTSRTAAVTLERDCYQKYGKAGRSFYNSQVASTIRWLGSCSTEDLLSRVPTDEAKSNVCNTDQDLVTGLVPPSVGGGDVLSPQPVPAHALHPEMESNSRTSVDKLERIALPRIPSMSEFVKRTRTMSTEPSDASARNSKKARLRSE